MLSRKRLKKLNEIVLPFRFTPKITIEGSINGKSFYFEKGKSYEITYAEFEVIMHSSYAKQFRD